MKFISAVTVLCLSVSVMASLPETEVKNFEAQYQIAKNSSLPMSVRWQAVLQASEVANQQQMQKILDFSKDKDWFIRNAALVALEKTGSDLVYDKAKELVTDKALVVRSAAVELLKKLKNSDVRRIFSEELSKKYNFNGASSLWIRPQMMTYLVESPQAEERSFFVTTLFEKDQQIALLSIQALEKLTQIRFVGKNDDALISQWRQYAKNQKW